MGVRAAGGTKLCLARLGLQYMAANGATDVPPAGEGGLEP